MNKFRFELNSKGVRDLLRSQEMIDVCDIYARQVQSKAGTGYKVSPYVGTNRVNVSVYTNTEEAIRDNLENNTLLKSLGAMHD